jgi:hypothetical protein
VSETTDIYKDLRAIRRKESEDRTLAAPKILQEAGLVFLVKNNGSHIIVSGENFVVDFWPANELWIVRGSHQRNYVIEELVEFCTNNGERS